MNFPRLESLSALQTETPLVSIILFCRNRAACVGRAVRSVLAQTYQNWELIIQDGASTDGTLEILSEFSDPRLHLISEPDSGPFDAMWRALRRTRGEIIGSCLSDEELLPETLSTGVNYFRCHPEAAGLCRDLSFTDLQGQVLSRYDGTEFNFHDYLGSKSTITLVTVLLRREAWDRVGFSTRDWRTDCADFEILARIGERFRLDYFPGQAAHGAQMHDGQLSTTPEVGFFCTRGHFRFIADFYQEKPSRRRLRNLALSNAYASVKRLYRLKQARQLEDQLDHYYKSFQVVKEAVDLELIEQAVGIGKLDLALNFSKEIAPSRPDYLPVVLAVLEIMEHLGYLEQAAQGWKSILGTGVELAEENYLRCQSHAPEANPEQTLLEQTHWAQQLARPNTTPFICPIKTRTTIPHLAFHGNNWRTREIRSQILPLIKHLDHRQFKISCYGAGPLPHEGKPFSPFLIETESDSTEEFVERIRSDRVDLLIELSDLSVGHRLTALAARCAPIQLTYLGHLATTGLPHIDYLLGDDLLFPPVADRYNTEKTLRLPACYTAFDFAAVLQPTTGPVSRRLDDRFTFGSLASSRTLNQTTLSIWAQLLQLVPGSRLLLANPDLASSDVRASHRAFFREFQLPAESLLLVPCEEESASPFLAAQMDLYLDRFPSNDPFGVAWALAQGIPSVTLVGPNIAGRSGASLLHCMALDLCLAYNLEQYVKIALDLSRDRSQLEGWRKTLPTRALKNGLTNVPLFAEQFTRVLQELLHAS